MLRNASEPNLGNSPSLIRNPGSFVAKVQGDIGFSFTSPSFVFLG